MNDLRLFVFCASSGRSRTLDASVFPKLGADALEYIVSSTDWPTPPDFHIAFLPSELINEFYESNTEDRVKLLAKQDSYTRAAPDLTGLKPASLGKWERFLPRGAK
mgnify:CR=1 FL=1